MASRKGQRRKIRRNRRKAFGERVTHDKGTYRALIQTQGSVRERTVLNALKKINPDWYVRGRAATNDEDEAGIDLVIEHRDLGIFPVQCKSSSFGVDKHRRIGKHKGTIIPYMIIKERNSYTTLVQKVEKIVAFLERRRELLEKFKDIKFETG